MPRYADELRDDEANRSLWSKTRSFPAPRPFSKTCAPSFAVETGITGDEDAVQSPFNPHDRSAQLID